MPSMISILRETFLFSLRFIFFRPVEILKEVLLPVVCGCAALYLLLSGYCGQLLDYLGHPNEIVASRVLGIAAAGLLIMLFLHAIVVAAIAGLVLDKKHAQPSFLGIRAAAWSIYTANLRLLLALCVGGLAFWLSTIALKRIWLLPDSGIIQFLLLAAVFCISVRAWFFVAPSCLIDKDGSPLTAAWRRSAGHFSIIAITMFVIFIGSIAFQAIGEALLRITGILAPFSHPETFAQAVMLYRENLFPMVAIVSLTYLIATVFLTAACMYLYKRLAVVTPPT